MNVTIVLLSIFILNFVKSSLSLSDITANDLKCEYLINPLAIESPHPRLSWTLKEVDSKKQNLTQKAYQILVSSDKSLLDSNKGDLWDTNKVLSNSNTHIAYNGVKLGSRNRSFWKVRVWDQNDSVSDYSSVAFWETGLIEENDWTAEWIGAPEGLQQNATHNVSATDSVVMKFIALM
jgi:alpha-L-rhamnosidase